MGKKSCSVLATAGDDVRIWSLQDFSSLHVLTEEASKSFQAIDWSPNFNNLASITSRGDKLYVNKVEMDSFKHSKYPMGDKCTALKYSNLSSRNVGIGTKVGLLHLYDLKCAKNIKSFQVEKEITCLDFYSNDSYIATGSTTGAITLHNIISCQSNAPLISKYAEGIRGLRFSALKNGILGCVSDDGGVRLWDIYVTRLLYNFPGHFSRATGLCFSPNNEDLLVSVGLDKKIRLLNSQTKIIVGSAECSSPLTSVDFKDDGVTIGVGSSKGEIFLFDIRSMKEPQKMFNAHKTSVQMLKFQNRVQKNYVTKRTYNNESNLSDTNFTSGLEVTDNSLVHPIVHDIQKYSLTSEVFSPLNDRITRRRSSRLPSPLAGDFNASGKDFSSKTSGCFGDLSKYQQNKNTVEHVTEIKPTLDMFSPIKETSCEDNKGKRRKVDLESTIITENAGNPTIRIQQNGDFNKTFQKIQKTPQRIKKTPAKIKNGLKQDVNNSPTNRNSNQHLSVLHGKENFTSVTKRRRSVKTTYDNQHDSFIGNETSSQNSIPETAIFNEKCVKVKNTPSEDESGTELHVNNSRTCQNCDQDLSVHYEENSTSVMKSRSYSANNIYDNQYGSIQNETSSQNFIPVKYIRKVVNDAVEDYVDELRKSMQIMHVRYYRMNQELKDDIYELRKAVHTIHNELFRIKKM